MKTQAPPSPAESPLFQSHEGVVYFDGLCGFCNGAVNFLMSHDRRGKLKYAPLQGETARQLLSPQDIQSLNSLIFTHNGKVWRQSSAAVRILWQLGPGWKLLGALLWVIPSPLRNAGYSLFARYRYRLFGKRESCRMPSPEERNRILP